MQRLVSYECDGISKNFADSLDRRIITENPLIASSSGVRYGEALDFQRGPGNTMLRRAGSEGLPSTGPSQVYRQNKGTPQFNIKYFH
jgi:hypothetical protein